MYSVSDEYENLILADSTQHALNIYIDETRVDDKYVLGLSFSRKLFENDEFCFGSTPAKTAELKIHINALPDTYNRIYIESGIDNSLLSELIPMGYFNVDKIEKENSYTVKLTLIDDMSKFEFNYDGSVLNYPTTTLEILQDICNTAGIELGSTSFLNSDAEVSVYDNTVTARTYIGYIAEQAGGFAVIGRDGKLYIKTIGEDTDELDIAKFADYTWGESFTVSRIAYEDGIQDFKTGDETNNTIWISSDNMYIVNQEQIDNIYNVWNEFDCYSFTGTSIVNPAWDIGDILIIDGKKIIYQGTMEYKGKFKASIESEIQAKSKEETTATTVSSTTLIRRVQSSIDQAEATITLLVEEIDENSEKISQFQVSLDEIKLQVGITEDYTYEETSTDQLHLTDTVAGANHILKLTIQGYIGTLMPSETLMPTSGLMVGGTNTIHIIFDSQSRTSKSDDAVSIELTLDEPLRYLVVDDEVIADEILYESGSFYLVRRVALNSSNELSVLSEETKELLLTTDLYTFADDTYIYVDEYEGLSYYAYYSISDNYVTESQLSSLIEQTASSITLSVSETLTSYATLEDLTNMENSIIDEDVAELLEKYVTTEELSGTLTSYSTTIEMNSAIELASNSITSTVDEKLTSYVTTEDLDGTLSSYSTTVQMNSAISQSKSSILSTVTTTLESYVTTTSLDGTLSSYSTTTQMNSAISQTQTSILNTVSATYATQSDLESTEKTIEASLELKVNTEDLISEINASADVITLTSNRISITSDNFTLTEEGTITATSGTIGGFTLGKTSFSSNFNGIYDYTSYDLRMAIASAMGWITLDDEMINILDVNDSGTVNSGDYLLIQKILTGANENTKEVSGTLEINTQNPKNNITVESDGTQVVSIGAGGINTSFLISDIICCGTTTSSSFSGILIDSSQGKMNFVDSNSSKVQITNSGVIECGSISAIDSAIIAGQVTVTNSYGTGYAIHGANTDHAYMTHWDGSQLLFYVDGTNVGNLSDERLKTDIEDVNENLIEAISNVDFKQFKLANRNDKTSIGIIAQDLINIFEKYNLSVDDYNIVSSAQYSTDDETLYYMVNYEQFMLLQQKYIINKLKELEEKING